MQPCICCHAMQPACGSTCVGYIRVRSEQSVCFFWHMMQYVTHTAAPLQAFTPPYLYHVGAETMTRPRARQSQHSLCRVQERVHMDCGGQSMRCHVSSAAVVNKAHLHARPMTNKTPGLASTHAHHGLKGAQGFERQGQTRGRGGSAARQCGGRGRCARGSKSPCGRMRVSRHKNEARCRAGP